ncbi:unnamed protein product [Allacma fusca]|uniref:PDZ domain-containing protein n=1 Tax=Allacma fusca TaxID=39272 RepID=A0A8J2NU65_9HEXA|nr:unnamed protein product [Allacma fusca]
MEEEPVLGPFITVVSVDGGIQTANKLTVITPTEINDSPRLSVVHEDVDEESPDEEESATNSLHGAYVTVLALGKKQELSSKNQKKSVVNICTDQVNSTPHVVAILSKTDRPIAKERKSKSIVDIHNFPKMNANMNIDIHRNKSMCESSSEVNKNTTEIPESNECVNKERTGSVNGRNENSNESDYVTEQVTVYKLPGERLGFGLRFHGGLTNPTEKVKQLFIQSCAEDSPAARTQASWGNLVEGDEILQIENVSVSRMTRMDCIQLLKDASVVLHLLICHFYSPPSVHSASLGWDDLCHKGNNNLNNSSSILLNQHDMGLGREDLDKLEILEPEEPVQPEPKLRHDKSRLFTSMDCEKGTTTRVRPSTPTLLASSAGAESVPVAPPRKGKPEVLDGPMSEPLAMKIKPPMGFADEDKYLLCLPPEAKVYTFAVESQEKGMYSSHSESLSICESDDSHSTRSTVVSRLSMMSMNNMTECSKRIEVVGQTSSLEGIEGVTSPSFSTQDDEGEDEIPLAPPLHFQDLTNNADDQRSSCLNSQLSYHKVQTESDGLVPLEFVLMQHEPEEERGFIENPLPYNSQLIDINDDDELALLAEELGLGQDDDEDEAEELRKFLLLEEKLRTIHDKDNEDKQDAFGSASSQRDDLAIAEEDEDEEEDDEEEDERSSQKEYDIFNDQLSVHNEIETTLVDNISLKNEVEGRKCNSETSNEFTSTFNNNSLTAHKKELIEGNNGTVGLSGATKSKLPETELTLTSAGDADYNETVLLTRHTNSLCQLDQQHKPNLILRNNPVIEPIFETDEQSDGTEEEALNGDENEQNKHETFVAILQVNSSHIKHPESHSFERISHVSTDTQSRIIADESSQWTTRVKVMGATPTTNVIQTTNTTQLTNLTMAAQSTPTIPNTTSTENVTIANTTPIVDFLSKDGHNLKRSNGVSCKISAYNPNTNDRSYNESIKEESPAKVDNLEQKSIETEEEKGAIILQSQNKPTLNAHNASDKGKY